MMSRFMQEITGTLDAQVAVRTNTENKHFWQNHAQAEVDKYMRECASDAVVEDDGAIRWKTGSYLMDDLCEMLEYGGFNFSRSATAEKRRRQVDESARAYRESMKHHTYTDEELGEMRNAFGRGTKVVNIITGTRILL